MKISTSMPPEMTPELTYLKGQFALWKYHIPYFSAVVPIKFAREKFSLIDEIPDGDRIEWSLEELFQRDIDWARVDRQLVGYLRNESKPQFFNALTVALLPKSGSGFSGKYETKRSYDRIADGSLEAPIQVGGIQVQSYIGSGGGAGRLRWDVNEVIAIAVDGQHRLAALKRLGTLVKPEQLVSSAIPVIFLIPHSAVGFREPPVPSGQNHAVTTLRRVFIDLNKHAKPVSTTRNILLDDQDITAVCTRTLIGERLTAKAETHRIPLPMVDWISDANNKIETGPFVTTILLLHEFVAAALNVPQFEDLELEDEDNTIRDWLVTAFDPNDEELSDLMAQVQRCFNQEVPLTFLPNDIAIMRKRFEVRWRPLVYRVFSELTPYATLWEFGRTSGLHTPQFVNLFAALRVVEDEKRAERIKATIKAHDPDWNEAKHFTAPLKIVEEELKGERWAFRVVFQKALFRSFVALHDHAPAFPRKKGITERDNYVARWLEAVNALLESPLGNTNALFGKPQDKFWAGIGINPDDTVDYTPGSAQRIGNWISLWVCLYWMRDRASLAKLDQAEGPLETIVANTAKKGVVTRGTKRLASARLEGNPSTSRVSALAEKLLLKRFDHLRAMASKLRP